MKKIGEVLPAFQKVQKSGKRKETEEDPPADVLHELLEGFPPLKTGVANYLPCGGTVELEPLVPRFNFGLRAEKEIKPFHPDRRIGNISFIQIQIDPLRGKSFPIDDATEIDPESYFLTTVTVRGEKDMISAPCKGGLKVLGTGVEIAGCLCAAELGKWRGRRVP
tara:strand:+ start:1133 stop:1627 length:495 start_codon:yes stop_codon:yes gene_type:complete